jgi:hypothetical protein
MKTARCSNQPASETSRPDNKKSDPPVAFLIGPLEGMNMGRMGPMGLMGPKNSGRLFPISLSSLATSHSFLTLSTSSTSSIRPPSPQRPLPLPTIHSRLFISTPRRGLCRGRSGLPGFADERGFRSAALQKGSVRRQGAQNGCQLRWHNELW